MRKGRFGLLGLRVIVILALIPASFAHAQISTAERGALIALYNSTDGANWSDNTGWLGSVGTECTWYGVTCGAGHVQGLFLGSNQLSGSIPPEVGNLSSLMELHLQKNQLSGVIPPELGDLSSLLQLRLHTNQLSGVIPPEMGNLSSLKNLSIYDNQLSGSIPAELGNLSRLKSLYLYHNQLSGSIPPELGNLSRLNYMVMHSNQLSGSIPPELGNLSSLSQLFLVSNQLSGSIPPELGNLSSLNELSLFSNQLSGSIPPELGNMSSLKKLNLQQNQLSGSIPAELENLSNLWLLHLYSNQLSGSIPPELGNMSSLGSLSLFSNQLSGSIPAELGNLHPLISLPLRYNALYSDNASLIAFLNRRHLGWQSTQTIAPVNLTIDSVGDHTIWLSWDAVSYQSDPGGYEVFSAPSGTGIWTSGGWTEAKTDTTFPVTGLDPTTSYDFAVVSYTDPHPINLNLVISDLSSQVMATTATEGCAQPIIEVAGVGGPITLSLMGSYDSYLWSTGETSSSIVVAPLSEQWHWVTVTSAGPCEETAATSVAPVTPDIFTDGFESGDTSAW